IEEGQRSVARHQPERRCDHQQISHHMVRNAAPRSPRQFKWTLVANINMLALRSVGKILMKCRAAALAVLLCTIFVNSNADARGPSGSISVGNWKGGAYTNDETGSFTHRSEERRVG